MVNQVAVHEETTRKQITATWKKVSDIDKWERAARLLGFSEPSDCIRELAEEARVLKIAKLEQASASAA